jgi:hypothetical protein
MKKAQTANFPEFEADMLATWKKEGTFAASLANRKNAKRFSFLRRPAVCERAATLWPRGRADRKGRHHSL